MGSIHIYDNSKNKKQLAQRIMTMCHFSMHYSEKMAQRYSSLNQKDSQHFQKSLVIHSNKQLMNIKVPEAKYVMLNPEKRKEPQVITSVNITGNVYLSLDMCMYMYIPVYMHELPWWLKW